MEQREYFRLQMVRGEPREGSHLLKHVKTIGLAKGNTIKETLQKLKAKTVDSDKTVHELIDDLIAERKDNKKKRDKKSPRCRERIRGDAINENSV
jgi:hypothetical protein